MGIDAVAVLPPVPGLHGDVVAGDWTMGEGPVSGSTGLWRPLSDGTLLNVGLPFETPDADVYDAARRWMGGLPPRIWVFPDVAVPDDRTMQLVIDATASVGRWIRAGRKRPTLLSEVGFSAGEEDAWQREMNSGDPKRTAAAMSALEERTKGRDPAELKALMAKFLRRG